MSKGKIMRLVLILGSALILVGVTLVVWTLNRNDEQNVIKVLLSDDATVTEQFESLRLVPGEECEYTVKLQSKKEVLYDLNLDFVETEDKTLKQFARVKILSNGQVLYDELLATAFEDEDIAVEVDFRTDKNTELTILYYLPIDVGNEAKNAEAIFELLLSANIK